MTPERWREVTRIYAAVVAREPDARLAALDAACGADAELRREVELPLAEDNGSVVIDRPAFAVTGVRTSQMPVQIGSQIVVYRIDALLGVGGMGEVYRARDTKLNRDVAIKLLSPAFASDPDRLARFKREAQVLASLNHPNIAAIYGLEEQESTSAIVMELVEGPTLAELIAGTGEAESLRSRPSDSEVLAGRGVGPRAIRRSPLNQSSSRSPLPARLPTRWKRRTNKGSSHRERTTSAGTAARSWCCSLASRRGPTPEQLNVTRNWFEELKQRVPVK